MFFDSHTLITRTSPLHLIVGGGGSIGASRSSVVSTGHRLVRMIIGSVGGCDSGPGESCVVRVAVVVVSCGSKSASSSGTNGYSASHLGVTSSSVVLLGTTAAKELGAASLGVTVGGRRAVALLLLVIATNAELDKSGHEEEKTIDEVSREYM